MMKNLKKYGILIITLSIFGVLSLLNHKNPDFLDFTLYELLTLLFFIVLGYFYIEGGKQNDALRVHIENLIQDIKIEVEIIDLHDCTDLHKYTIMQRRVSNKLNLLNKINYKLIDKNDLNYINEQFSDYKEFYGDHYEDIEHMFKSKSELARYKSNIQDKIDEIVLGFYCDIK